MLEINLRKAQKEYICNICKKQIDIKDCYFATSEQIGENKYKHEKICKDCACNILKKYKSDKNK